jgi:multiple sugar transport system substrate-binding protein
MNGRVKIEFIEVDPSQIAGDIINEANSQFGLYDGYITNPQVAGSVVELQGWADLTPFIEEQSDRVTDWADIFLGYRKSIAQYGDRIILFPLDGDSLSMYYRKDILKHFNLTVPRTWEEYNAVAAATHGQEYEGETLSGSCVGRKLNCANAYWTNLLISSMTQTLGASSGHFFDTKDMTPLTGEALEEALKLLEMQVKYGPDDGKIRQKEANSDMLPVFVLILTHALSFSRL